METDSKQKPERKPYQKPELVEYGELKDLTLGSGSARRTDLKVGSWTV
ncbi:MAG TPA: lasso RiPP family leader peptide-containing protein [Anaerolineales bacterium]|nr:lasso RiPP family leader peptide-containing protein [Anaerolineales bacterium]